MLKEFEASLASSRIIAWPSLERPFSPPMALQLQDEAPTVMAPQLEDEDSAVVGSCALRTSPPRPIHWVVDSPNLTVDAGPPSSPPVDTHPTKDNDDSVKRRLDSFISEVTHKWDSPQIREPPKQPPAKPVMPWRSRRLSAQPLSRAPASKRGEALIMQRMGFTKGPSTSSASELAAYDKLFGDDLTVSEAKALDELFPAVRSRQPRGRKSTS